MKDFCIEQSDSPNALVYLGKELGDGGVNIEGLCVYTDNGKQVIHFVVKDADKAREILEKSGIKINAESDVFILNKDKKEVTGKSGSFGAICKTLADHSIKINFGYPAENNRYVFGVDDVVKARELLE